MMCASACTAGGCESPATTAAASSCRSFTSATTIGPFAPDAPETASPRPRAPREALHLGGAQREPVVGVRTRERRAALRT